MRKSVVALIALSALIVGHTRPAAADADSCRDALDQEETAKSELTDARDRYSACIDGGDEDCSTEFAAVHAAQEEWEDAVSNRQGECS